MAVFRTEKVSDYAVIAKHHLKNRTLSYKAKGLLTFMLSVPPDWDWSLAGLATLASDGIDGVRSGIKELERQGYLSRRRIRDPNGRLGDIEYTIHEIPPHPNEPHGGEPAKPTPTGGKPTQERPILENPTLAMPPSAKPILDFPTQENSAQAKPTQGLPTQKNPMQCSNEVLSINQFNTKEPSNKNTQQAECLKVETARGAETSANHTMTLAEQQFELFWQLYPRKAGKKAARKAWLDINPDDAMVLIITKAIGIANQYWQHQGISLNHIPHPATWLNEERWDDEFAIEQLSGNADSESGVAESSTKNNANSGLDTRIFGGDGNADIGANYRIGGDDDPYKSLITG